MIRVLNDANEKIKSINQSCYVFVIIRHVMLSSSILPRVVADPQLSCAAEIREFGARRSNSSYPMWSCRKENIAILVGAIWICNECRHVRLFNLAVRDF
jgi:hypothetical protein